jgi:hypothetical protein
MIIFYYSHKCNPMSAIKNHLLQMEPLTPFDDPVLRSLTLEEWDCLLSCDLQHKNPDLFVRLLHTRNLIAANKDIKKSRV